MSNDENSDAHKQHELQKWHRNAPQSPDYGRVLTEDEAAHHDHAIREWYRDRPAEEHCPYDDGRG